MPCMCWYEPADNDKKEIKKHCEELVRLIHRLNTIGDPLGCSLEDIKKLLEHLYYKKCDEKH